MPSRQLEASTIDHTDLRESSKKSGAMLKSVW